MTSSDYLAVKKQKLKLVQPFPNTRSSSENTRNNQYYMLAHTTILDEDRDILAHTRYKIPLSSRCNYSFYWNNQLVHGYNTLFSIKKIQVPEYIKNRYQPPFCWTCFTPYGEIMHEIACSVCGHVNEQNLQEQSYDAIQRQNEAAAETDPEAALFHLTKTNFVDISKIINDFENSEFF
jgi:hypothetical protein